MTPEQIRYLQDLLHHLSFDTPTLADEYALLAQLPTTHLDLTSKNVLKSTHSPEHGKSHTQPRAPYDTECDEQ